MWLLIIDQTGASLAYAKLAYLELSTQQLVREANFTQWVVGRSLRNLAVPSVLHAGRLGDGYLMISQSLANATRVRPVLGPRTARATTNRRDPASIRAAVAEAITIARLSEPDPELPPLSGEALTAGI